MRVGDFDAKNKDFLKMVVGSIVAGVQANLVLRALVLEGGRERTLGTRVGGCDARGGEGRAPSWRVTARVPFRSPTPLQLALIITRAPAAPDILLKFFQTFKTALFYL